MYNLLLVIGFADDAQANARASLQNDLIAAGALAGVRDSMVQPTLPGVYNGGDIIARLVTDDATALGNLLDSNEWRSIEARLTDAALVKSLERVEYEGGDSGGTSPGTGLYRVALFCANVNPSTERLAAFGRQTASMPRSIRSIRRWQLSQAAHASGSRPWTHVWEQEYENLEGLNGPYMMHPAHWAHVERWFDTEYPDYLVDRFVVHTFCSIDKPVIIA